MNGCAFSSWNENKKPLATMLNCIYIDYWDVSDQTCTAWIRAIFRLDSVMVGTCTVKTAYVGWES